MTNRALVAFGFGLITHERPNGASYVENWDDLKRLGTWYGTSLAPVTIVEFMDYECPACRGFHESLKQAMRESGSPIALLLIQHPLPYHRFAKPAAVAAECAGRAGRFSQMTDILYSKQDSFGLKSWGAYAAEAGVADTNVFIRCFKAQPVTSRMARDMAAGDSIRASTSPIRGTPTVIINGWRYHGNPSAAELTKLLQNPPKPGTSPR